MPHSIQLNNGVKQEKYYWVMARFWYLERYLYYTGVRLVTGYTDTLSANCSTFKGDDQLFLKETQSIKFSLDSLEMILGFRQTILFRTSTQFLRNNHSVSFWIQCSS